MRLWAHMVEWQLFWEGLPAFSDAVGEVEVILACNTFAALPTDRLGRTNYEDKDKVKNAKTGKGKGTGKGKVAVLAGADMEGHFAVRERMETLLLAVALENADIFREAMARVGTHAGLLELAPVILRRFVAFCWCRRRTARAASGRGEVACAALSPERL